MVRVCPRQNPTNQACWHLSSSFGHQRVRREGVGQVLVKWSTHSGCPELARDAGHKFYVFIREATKKNVFFYSKVKKILYFFRFFVKFWWPFFVLKHSEMLWNMPYLINSWCYDSKNIAESSMDMVNFRAFRGRGGGGVTDWDLIPKKYLFLATPEYVH